ncbi:Transposon TX1 uncharacterized 82 kDa protein [Labeo rohita]|uniref:Transposon TX1 uncharacterized 82 kDa protein n=1 Tax=Labeo rohita TaxID=84645 RepID=A0ABQ8KZQ3_LABRO|nr:Transposon TX1 uncharacterized 82 kDa protein [Labeo rohita]
MAAQNTITSLDSLTRRHGVKVVSVVNVEECILAVGDVVGHECVLAASRMNSAIVLFLSSVEKANEVVEKGVIISGLFTPVLPLSTPAKKVTLSNVPPFIKDEMLIKELSRFGKIVSPMKKIALGSKSDLIKHVVSFRRFIYMILNDNRDELNLNLKLRVDDFDYSVFVSTDVIKCFGCGKIGHLVRFCPDKNDKNMQDDSTENGVQVRDEGTTDIVPEPAQVEPRPSTSGLTDILPPVQTEEVNQAIVEKNGDESGFPFVGKSESKADKSMDLSHVNVLSDKASLSETASLSDNLMMDIDQAVFKAPLKRKKKDKVLESKQARKTESEKESDVDDIGNESDFSDSGASSCSQSEWICQDYDTEEIRKFLKLTKNLRGVQVADYFPDIKRFVENTRIFMSEGCFTNKEVYRLKKFVTKLQNQLKS